MQPAPPSSVMVPSVPRPPPPSSASRVNLNLRSNALGRLCWARREVGLSIADMVEALVLPSGPAGGGQSSTPRTFRSAADRLAKAAEAADSDARSDGAFAEAGLRSFQARVAEVSKAALPIARAAAAGDDPSVAYAKLLEMYSFEKFPGLSEYMAAAKVESRCVQP